MFRPPDERSCRRAYRCCEKIRERTNPMTKNFFENSNGAQFSECRKYRYTLWRKWFGGDGYLAVIGLNPSTADERLDDPTIRRCINFAKAWGYSGYCMLNLFAYRATDPNDMKAVEEPIGFENNKFLIDCTKNASLVLAAWGNHGTYMNRETEVKAMIPNMKCLRLTKEGSPGHPLYLPKNLTPIDFT